MKPNFALKLSHDGLELLQRVASGWIVTGSTRFDASDLDSKLRQLRQQAEALAPEGLRSKLILPDSEVRYATVIAPGPTDEARRLQIEAEIEGLTPYALHELAYDYVVEGDHALVAICAREILAEAEDFAQTHGFNPVSFAATPPAGAFSGEPFFGETSGARAFLSRDTSVERDREPVRIVNQQKTTETAKPATATPPQRPATAKPAPAAARAAPATPGHPAPPTRPAEPSAVPETFSRVGNLVRRMGTRIRREQAQAEALGAPAKPAQAPEAKASSEQEARVSETKHVSPEQGKTTAPAQVPSGSPALKERDSEEAKPKAASGQAIKPEDQTASAPTPKKSSGPPKPVPPRPTTGSQGAKPAPVAFSSRRGAAPQPASGPATAPGPKLVAESPGTKADKPNLGGRIAVLPAKADKDAPGRMTRLYRRGRRSAKGVLARIGLSKAPESGKQRSTRKRDTDVKALVPASAPPASEREKATEAEALTIFGARSMQRAETSFARRGLMLTGGLLLLMVAVAIWAIYFNSGPAREGDLAQAQQEEISSLPPIDAPAQAPAPEPEPAEITAPAPVAPATGEDTADAVEEAAPEPEAEAAAPDEAISEIASEETAPVQTTDPDALLEELVQEALSEAMPVDLLGQTGQGVSSPGEADEAALEGMESPQAIAEGERVPEQQLALPPQLDRPQLAEVAPASPPPPPPFGTEFSLGPDGMVEATPEGALTPAGVVVYSGQPSEVPPVRPAGIAPEPASPAETEEEPEAQLQAPEEAEEAVETADETPRADPALAGARPQPRSPVAAELAEQMRGTEENAAPDPATETAPEGVAGASDPEDDSAALAPPPGGVLLDALRPQRRPTDLVPPVEVAEAEAEAGIEADEAPEVVAVSLRPTARPSDISARVQEALAAARSTPAATTAPSEPAPSAAASAAPNIPTSASVAQQATQTRAINLRRVNLVGVFGTPNDRRALVRLSNGQVVRVRVGDRLDGGQVSAISDDELRYVKNGRNEVLRIGSSG